MRLLVSTAVFGLLPVPPPQCACECRRNCNEPPPPAEERPCTDPACQTRVLAERLATSEELARLRAELAASDAA